MRSFQSPRRGRGGGAVFHANYNACANRAEVFQSNVIMTSSKHWIKLTRSTCNNKQGGASINNRAVTFVLGGVCGVICCGSVCLPSEDTNRRQRPRAKGIFAILPSLRYSKEFPDHRTEELKKLPVRRKITRPRTDIYISPSTPTPFDPRPLNWRNAQLNKFLRKSFTAVAKYHRYVTPFRGLYMGPNNLFCVTPQFLLFLSVCHVTFYKNFTSSRHLL